MTPADIPFDMRYRFGDDLREIPDSADEMRRGVDFVRDRLRSKTSHDGERLEALGMLGAYLRILGELDSAELCLLQALELAGTLRNRRLQTANRIRLAHVYQWKADYAAADRIYQDVIAECERAPELQRYLDFACQHYGKSLFDQGRYSEAETLFRRALDLRLPSGNDELIESTRVALRAVQTRSRT